MSPAHVALLRGVDVGGHGRLPMAALREAVAALGHAEVRTYLQSGNVVFLPGRVSPEVRESVAAALERAAARGSADEAVVVDGVLHLRTPDGMGRSELATQLARAGGPLARDRPDTVRGWRTVLALADLTVG